MKPPTIRRLVLGLLAGASLGAAEMAVQVAGNMEPSVARRVVSFLTYGAILGAFTAGVALLGAFALARLPGVGTAKSKSSFVPACAGAVIGLLAGGEAIRIAGRDLWRSDAAPRWAALAGSILLGAAVALFVRWFLARREEGRVHRFLSVVFTQGRVLAGSVALLVIASGGAFMSARGVHEAVTAPAGAVPEAGIPGRPNIILILVDTLRPDSLSSFGGAPGATPNVDALALSGVRFERAIAPSPWTLPSVASLFTSAPPREHGFVDFDSKVSDELATLPETLSNSGYDCKAVVGNPLASVKRGFARGFEFFDVNNYRIESHLFSSGVFCEILRLTGALGQLDRAKNPVPWLDPGKFPFIDSRLSYYVADQELNDRLFQYSPMDPGRPLFLYVHYIAPHTPYLVHPYRFVKSMPPKVLENKDLLRSLYEGEVRYMDTVLGDLMTRLGRAGILDNAIVAFVGDHGEEFQEHKRWEHGHHLYQELIHVPIILSGSALPRLAPGMLSGSSVGTPVELIDVAPTLAALAGVAPPASFRGRSLAGLLAGDSGSYPPLPIFSELTSRYLNEKDDYRSVLQGNLKVIRHRRPDGKLVTEEIFDLAADPGEKSPLAVVPEGAAALRAALDDYERAGVKGTSDALSQDELQKMRALGYVQ